ncbi:MAG: sulfurtransferase TusA family protein [Deltaproteobacteria bacterium]|jgi:TusA-related sulfurtransferase|nr:sulfurtransferase TusA family protein [Deltaproteobacteria bacterium]
MSQTKAAAAASLQPDAELDITDVVCPMTFVKVKAALDDLDEGQILAVRLNDGEPVQNVPRSLKDEGHKVLKLSEAADGTYRLLVRRAPD